MMLFCTYSYALLATFSSLTNAHLYMQRAQDVSLRLIRVYKYARAHNTL